MAQNKNGGNGRSECLLKQQRDGIDRRGNKMLRWQASVQGRNVNVPPMLCDINPNWEYTVFKRTNAQKRTMKRYAGQRMLPQGIYIYRRCAQRKRSSIKHPTATSAKGRQRQTTQTQRTMLTCVQHAQNA